MDPGVVATYIEALADDARVGSGDFDAALRRRSPQLVPSDPRKSVWPLSDTARDHFMTRFLSIEKPYRGFGQRATIERRPRVVQAEKRPGPTTTGRRPSPRRATHPNIELVHTSSIATMANPQRNLWPRPVAGVFSEGSVSGQPGGQQPGTIGLGRIEAESTTPEQPSLRSSR